MATMAVLAEGEPSTLSRRGRPTQQRVAEIDRTILLAAVDGFLAAGYEGTNMESVAATAAVSKGTLYSRYASKKALFRTALEYQLELISARASRRNHLAPSAFEPRLRHHAETMIDSLSWAEYQNMARLLETAMFSQPELARVWQELVSKRFRDLIIEAMQQTADVPAAAEIDWAFLADLYLYTIGGWLKAEFASRTVERDEALRHVDKVIAVISATLASMLARQN